MKNKLPIPIFCFFLILASCKKETDRPAITPETLSLDSVKAWYNGHQGTTHNLMSKDGPASFALSMLQPDLNRLQPIRTKRGNYWIVDVGGGPEFRHIGQGYRKLAFQRDSLGRLRARILEIIPDGLYFQRKRRATTADFTGRVFLFDETYQLTGGYVYSGGKIIGKIRPGQKGQTTLRTENIVAYSDCQWYEDTYIDSEGVITVYAERDCISGFYDDGLGYDEFDSGGGGDYLGGGASAAPAEPANLPGESGPGVSALAYTKCFGQMPTDQTTKMQVTVYVQEPLPGTTFNIGPNSVGHTAIGLTKTTGAISVTQTLGFYPDASGLDKMNAPGKLVDNSGLDYNVSITYDVDAVTFANIINYLNLTLPQYDLTDFNCTSYVYSACQYAGIILPNPYTTVGMPYPDGTVSQAMTPGGLGGNIQRMQGKPGVNTQGGKVGVSNGPCN